MKKIIIAVAVALLFATPVFADETSSPSVTRSELITELNSLLQQLITLLEAQIANQTAIATEPVRQIAQQSSNDPYPIVYQNTPIIATAGDPDPSYNITIQPQTCAVISNYTDPEGYQHGVYQSYGIEPSGPFNHGTFTATEDGQEAYNQNFSETWANQSNNVVNQIPGVYTYEGELFDNQENVLFDATGTVDVGDCSSN